MVSLMKKYKCSDLFLNKDYENYAIERDKKIDGELKKIDIKLHQFKDQVIFEEKIYLILRDCLQHMDLLPTKIILQKKIL